MVAGMFVILAALMIRVIVLLFRILFPARPGFSSKQSIEEPPRLTFAHISMAMVRIARLARAGDDLQQTRSCRLSFDGLFPHHLLNRVLGGLVSS